MALTPITPRDRLQRLVDLGRKTMRNWWLVALFAVGGGALSLAFAITRTRNYQAEAVFMYEERIQSSLLTNREESAQRNIGDRYRELLLAGPQLSQIISDPKLNPYPTIKDPQEAVDKLRQAVKFEARGGVTFRVTYADADPDRAKAVTERLSKILQDTDEQLANEGAARTEQFASKQKDEADAELRKRDQALAEFLAKHPEFAQDTNQPNGGEGGAIRAIHSQKATPVGNSRLGVLERQRIRLQARLDAPPDAPPIRVPAPPSPEKIAAEGAVTDAQHELNAANRELEDALSKYTDKHPTVIKAQERVSSAQQKLRHAQAAVPPDMETPLAPATPADRTKIQKELAQIESQIADEQKRAGTGKTDISADATTNWVVQLETQFADLRRAVNEQSETVASLTASERRAHTDAQQKLAEQGRLQIINPAEKPSRPTGPGKTIFLLAGMALFLALGMSLAVGLAVIDDRLYGRYDIDQLGIPVLAVIPKRSHAVTKVQT